VNSLDLWALDLNRTIKPLDFGCNGITGSVDPYGRLIALNTYHDQVGYITLTTADPFPEDHRYDPSTVRAYRAALARLDGFGPRLAVTRSEAFLLEYAIPSIRLTTENGSVITSTTIGTPSGAVQHWESDQPLRFQGRLSLQRCAYTQLTEGGPVEMPPVITHAVLKDGTLTIENPALQRTVTITGFAPGESWERRVDGPIDLDLWLPPDATLTYTCGDHAADSRSFDKILEAEQLRWLSLAQAPDRLTRRGLLYGLLLAVPVGDGICILTDHMLLPLAWNRDAYYVARAFLSWNRHDLVDRHLRWMFATAERPQGYWGRCYLANGRIKDHAFQFDQQLFPLLELAEYVLSTGEYATWDQFRPHIYSIRAMLLARRAADEWRFPTDETPADDPLVLPYHFSSHQLFWHTARLLHRIDPVSGWDHIADHIRAAINHHFIVQRDADQLFAYAVDGRGGFHLYHDANDIPLVLAPIWGFCPADDPIWLNTLAFAFSDANPGGFYTGHLGSVHTRAPWPLGDIQAAIVARIQHDAAREQQILTHLDSIAQWDGALPEAYDASTGAIVSRTWFAWPNAALACLQLGAFE